MLKVDIHRPVGAEDDTFKCDGAVVAVLLKKEDGTPEDARAIIAGELSFLDLLVLTRMIVSHTQEVARGQFNQPDFDIVEALRRSLRSPLDGILERFDTTKVPAH